MKKKMIIAAVFVAAIAITASVAFATTPSCGCDRHHRHNNDCCPSVEVNADTNATVRTCVRTSANSGRNHVSSFGGGANATTGSSNAQTNSSTTVLGSDVYVND